MPTGREGKGPACCVYLTKILYGVERFKTKTQEYKKTYNYEDSRSKVLGRNDGLIIHVSGLD